MADYWALDDTDPLATNLVIGCMFDQPNLIDQVLNFTSPFTLTEEGTPTRPTVEGKLAFQPAEVDPDNTTRLQFDDQWVPRNPLVSPITIMTRFSSDLTPPFSTNAGLGQVGRTSGAGGIYLYCNPAGNIVVGAASWTDTIETSYTITADTLYRVITRYGDINGGATSVDLHVDNVSIGSRTAGTTSNDETCDIGNAFGLSFGLSFPGPITDYFVWDRLLSDQEIADLFADPYGFLIPPDTGAAATQNAIMHGMDF